MRDTRLLQGLLLSRSDIDRAAHRRSDDEWLGEASSHDRSRMVIVSEGEVAILRSDEGMQLALHPVEPTGDLSFLGEAPDGTWYFASHVSRDDRPEADWASLREAGELFDDREAGLAVTAIALDNWHRTTRQCGECGDRLRTTQAGWAKKCDVDGSDHFPRTDPAVIMLPRDRSDRALLGRHVDWPEGRFSTFAGFVEAGESAEAAVRRELQEESGIVVADGDDDLIYLGSQPWPFPRSLMLGYHAWTDDPTIDLGADEIAEARWFTRESLQADIASGAVRLPPPISISRRLIERWLAESA